MKLKANFELRSYDANLSESQFWIEIVWCKSLRKPIL